MSDHSTTPDYSDGRDRAFSDLGTEHKLDGSMGRLSHEMNALRAEALPRLTEAMERAQNYGRERVEAMRESARDLKDKAADLGNSTTSFVRQRPMQSLLIAAVSGVALAGLFSLLSRNRRR